MARTAIDQDAQPAAGTVGRCGSNDNRGKKPFRLVVRSVSTDDRLGWSGNPYKSGEMPAEAIIARLCRARRRVAPGRMCLIYEFANWSPAEHSAKDLPRL